MRCEVCPVGIRQLLICPQYIFFDADGTALTQPWNTDSSFILAVVQMVRSI